jgi:hypothetical protein
VDLEIDPDVKAVAEFMQSRMRTDRLVPVVAALSKLAPALWGHYKSEEVIPLSLSCESPTVSRSEIPQAAT